MGRPALRVTTRNSRFQQWEALLANRTKRQRAGAFVVQGVRPVTLAVRSGWPVRELLYRADARLSTWAREMLDMVPAARFAVADELMAELGGKTGTVPELLAVVALPDDDLGRIPTGPALLGLSPGPSCCTRWPANAPIRRGPEPAPPPPCPDPGSGPGHGSPPVRVTVRDAGTAAAGPAAGRRRRCTAR